MILMSEEEKVKQAKKIAKWRHTKKIIFGAIIVGGAILTAFMYFNQ